MMDFLQISFSFARKILNLKLISLSFALMNLLRWINKTFLFSTGKIFLKKYLNLKFLSYFVIMNLLWINKYFFFTGKIFIWKYLTLNSNQSLSLFFPHLSSEYYKLINVPLFCWKNIFYTNSKNNSS